MSGRSLILGKPYQNATLEIRGLVWQSELFGSQIRVAIQTEVLFAVIEVIFKFAAGSKLVVWRDGNVALVEQPMNVGPEKQAVVDAMLAFFGYWLDVSSFKCGKGFFTGDCASAMVSVCYQDSERTLTETLSELTRLST